MSNITVREWIEKFNHGEFDNEDFETQCAAGWYDDKFPYGKPQTDEVARGSGTESMAVRD